MSANPNGQACQCDGKQEHTERKLQGRTPDDHGLPSGLYNKTLLGAPLPPYSW
jgi:hypothetical protein